VRDYEVVVVLKPDIDDEDQEKLIESLESWLTQGDEDSDKPVADHWGHRSLAYPVEKYREGYYIFYTAKLDPMKIGDVERNITYQEDVLRHLVVRKVA
jgi:small subunit ribosomal protein S6